MKIKHYLYNTFVIESGKSKVAIDPGQYLYMFNLKSLIPKEEWKDITHLVITHGDPDHHWQSDRVAEASDAHVICGKEMTKTDNGQILLVAPRGRELTSWIPFKNTHPMEVGDVLILDDVEFEAVRSVHGPIQVSILGFKKIQYPGPNERVGLGSMGFKINLDGKVVLNLADSLLLEEWQGLKPDVLMLPIGGLGNNTWTMDVPDALNAVNSISPKLVIPCHYSVPFLWSKKYCPADDQKFKSEIEKMGIECRIMGYADEIEV